MINQVAIVGIGTTGFRATTPDVSYRELTYEAAKKAYLDCGISPKEIGAFVATSEDFLEGYSISDEYSPDQLGAVLKPIYTVPGDFIQSLGSGVMMVLSGLYDIVVVQALSKASNMLTKPYMIEFAMDPLYARQLRELPDYVAGLDMARYMFDTGTTKEDCAQVVVKNRRNAMFNPYAAHGCDLSLDYVMSAEPVSYPLGELDISQHCDGAVVVVLARGDVAPSLTKKPIWIRGISWISDTPNLERMEWGKANYAQLAAKKAYAMAGIKSPRTEIDFAEINDEFSYKELMHMEALGLCNPGEARHLVRDGFTEIDGGLPVNTMGGVMGVGNAFEANGAHLVLSTVLQLRGEAGRNQLKDVHTGLAMSWRGIPTNTGAVVILSN